MLDFVVIALYMLGMIGIGVWATKRSKNEEDFLVAGRRLGPTLYAGTMAAVVLGGASTVGAVGLGYQHGISGMWLVFSIGCGILLLSFAFAAWINRLEVYTVAQMFELRYGPGVSRLTGIVMAAYTFMLSVTSTVAYGTIFAVLFDLERVPAILLGGSVVIAYSVLGGMWSITLTDFVQFLIKTVGIFFILLPILLVTVGGMDGMRAALPETAFSITHIGGQTIITYFVVYFLGLVIGQDIWQRVFTARSEGVAKWAGVTSGVYCILYAFAGVLIGMCAKVLLPDIEVRDKVYPTIVEYALPVGISGLVMAAALSAIMSTSSGALIATATVVKEDILEKLTGRTAPPETSHEQRDEVRHSRIYILLFGVLMIAAACVVRGVVEALTIAYDILVGGLMVAIIGGFLWPRGTLKGALASIIVGTALTLGTMWAVGDVYANEPIFAGIGGSLLVYVVVSLMTPATPAAIRDEWNRRIKSRRADQASAT
jgi:SSS family solute:Na+ symporter